MKQLARPASPRWGMAFAACAFLCFAAGFLLYPGQVQEAVRQNMENCFLLLIPSLFPFIALTSFAVNSPVSTGINRIFGFLCVYIFRLPRVCTTAVLMGLIGGYPAGASGISALLKNGSITKKQAGRMLCFCVNPGTAFVISFLGGTVLKSRQTGLLLFASILAGSILLGFFTGLIEKIPKEALPASNGQKTGAAIILAAQDAARGIVKMCACILLFSAFAAVLAGSGLIAAASAGLADALQFSQPQANALVQLLLEITNGVFAAAAVQTPSVFYAFALAFGGICVHLQTFSFFRVPPVSMLRFLLFRLFHSLLSGCIFLFLLPHFPNTQEVFFSTAPHALLESRLEMSPAGAVSLLLMSTAFLLICALPQTTVLGKKQHTKDCSVDSKACLF